MLYISKPPFGRSMHKGRLFPPKKMIIVIHSASIGLCLLEAGKIGENRPRSTLVSESVLVNLLCGSTHCLSENKHRPSYVFSHFQGLCLFKRHLLI